MSAFVLVLGCSALLMLLSSAWQMGDGLIPSGVRASTPDTYEVTAPLHLTQNPSLQLVAGKIELAQKTSRTALQRLLSGSKQSGHILLNDGRFILQMGRKNSNRETPPPGGTPSDGEDDNGPDNLIAPLLQALAKFGFDRLDVSNTEILLKSSQDRPRGSKAPVKAIKKISAKIVRQSSGIISAEGRFEYRERLLSFSGSFGGRTGSGSHGFVPLRFKLESGLLTAKFEGQAALNSGLQLQGEMTATASDLRKVAQWLHRGVPNGTGVGKFEITGQASLVGSKLSFEKAVLALDGNRADGGISLDFGKPRLFIEGTLATDKLELSQYFKAAAASPQSFAMPMLRFFDADVRLSASQVILGANRWGRAAAAISLGDGKLMADVAEIEIAEGQGIGQLTLDMSHQVPGFAVRGKFSNVNIAEFTKDILGADAISGSGWLIVSLESSGRTRQEIMRALSGRVQMALPDGGYIGVDPTAMVEAARSEDLQGWSGTQRATKVSRANATLRAQNGIFKTETMEALSGAQQITCNGNLNLPQRRLNLTVRFGKAKTVEALAAADASPLAARSEDEDVLKMRGSWDGPVISLEHRRKRARAAPPVDAAPQQRRVRAGSAG